MGDRPFVADPGSTIGLPPHLSIVVPAYNEEARLPGTVGEMVAYCRGLSRPVEILIVDDGSSDSTAAVASELAARYPEVRLIRCRANRGKGYAVRTGVLEAVGSSVLFADADGATPISELKRLETALDAGADIAIGSRALAADDVLLQTRWYRRLIGRAFHCMVTLLGVRGFADTQCGFKLFRAASARAVFRRARIDRFAFDVEVLLLARALGYRVAEVPVSWTHKAGSRINLVMDSWRMLIDLVRIRWSVLRRAGGAS